PETAAAAASCATLPGIAASSAGPWGNNLWIAKIKKVDSPNLAELKTRYNAGTSDLYDVTVVEREYLYTRQVPDPNDATKKIDQKVYRPVRTEALRNIVFDKA